MPLPYRDKTNFISNEYITVNSAGFITEVGQREIYRPNGRVDVHILYCTEGKYEIVGSDTASELLPGNGYIFLPGTMQYYRKASEENASRFWVHFAGTGSEDVLKKAGLYFDGGIEFLSDGRIEAAFEELTKEFRLRRPGHELICQGLLVKLLGVLASCRPGVGSEKQMEKERLYPAIKRMHEGYYDKITVEELAFLCELSPSRFMHAFKDAVGSSAHSYLLSIRLEKAKNMLTASDRSIAEIASLCGFDDGLYFSRYFTKAVGVSPSAYRKGS